MVVGPPPTHLSPDLRSGGEGDQQPFRKSRFTWTGMSITKSAYYDRPDRPARPFLKLRNFLRYRKKNLLATDPTDPTDPPDRFWNSVIFERSKGNLLATDPTDPPDRFWNYVIFWDVWVVTKCTVGAVPSFRRFSLANFRPRSHGSNNSSWFDWLHYLMTSDFLMTSDLTISGPVR